jgi:hypothetical protein
VPIIIFNNANTQNPQAIERDSERIKALLDFFKSQGVSMQIEYSTSFRQLEYLLNSLVDVALVFSNFPPDVTYQGDFKELVIPITNGLVLSVQADSYTQSKATINTLCTKYPQIPFIILTGAPKDIVTDDEILEMGIAGQVTVKRKRDLMMSPEGFEAATLNYLALEVSNRLKVHSNEGADERHSDQYLRVSAFIQAEKDAIEQLVQWWYRDILLLVNTRQGFCVKELPVKLDESGGLNVSISGNINSPRISISIRFIRLLMVSNRFLIEIGLIGFSSKHADPEEVQRVIDMALDLVFRMNPPQVLPPSFGDIFKPQVYDDYRAMMLERKEVEEDIAGLRKAVEPLVNLLIQPKQQNTFIEWQVKFLLLHEMAHMFLGHTGKSHTHQHELDADDYAASLLFEYFRSRTTSGIDLSPIPFILLFITVSFMEDLVDLVNACIEFAIPDDFKKGFRPIRMDYPQARHRIEKLIKAHMEMNSYVVAMSGLVDYGLITIKDQFQYGIVDLKYFKWYCRVRAEEMTASYAMRLMTPEARAAILSVLEFQRGWDSTDLKRGPLQNIVFRGNWYEPVLIGKQYDRAK